MSFLLSQLFAWHHMSWRKFCIKHTRKALGQSKHTVYSWIFHVDRLPKPITFGQITLQRLVFDSVQRPDSLSSNRSNVHLRLKSCEMKSEALSKVKTSVGDVHFKLPWILSTKQKSQWNFIGALQCSQIVFKLTHSKRVDFPGIPIDLLQVGS